MSEFEQYNHHGNVVWVRSRLKGKHRENCLCHSCAKLNIEDREKNCPRANLLYALCVLLNMTTPVFECPEFEESAIHDKASYIQE